MNAPGSADDHLIHDQLKQLLARVESLEASRRALEAQLVEKQAEVDRSEAANRALNHKISTLQGDAPARPERKPASSKTRLTARVSSEESGASKISARTRARQRMEARTGRVDAVALEETSPVLEPIQAPPPPMTGEELVKQSGVIPSFRLEQAVEQLSSDDNPISTTRHTPRASASEVPVAAAPREGSGRWASLLWSLVFALIACGAVWLLFQLIRRDSYTNGVVSPRLRERPAEVRLPDPQPIDYVEPSSPTPARVAEPRHAPVETTPTPKPEIAELERGAASSAPTGLPPEQRELAEEGIEVVPDQLHTSPPPVREDRPAFEAAATLDRIEKVLQNNNATEFEELLKDFSRFGETELLELRQAVEEGQRDRRLMAFVEKLFAKSRR